MLLIWFVPHYLINDIPFSAGDTSLFVVVENDHTAAAAANTLTEALNVISNIVLKG